MSIILVFVIFFLDKFLIKISLECEDLCDGCSGSSNNCEKCVDSDKDINTLCTTCRGTKVVENNVCVCTGNLFDDGTEICATCVYKCKECE